MTITIKKCTIENLSMLQEISYVPFNETIKNHNSTENMNAFLERGFNLHQLEKELSNMNSPFFFFILMMK